MVFENILDYRVAEKKSFLVFLYAFILTTISIFVGSMIFPESASIVFLFLITIPAAQMVYNELKEDEKEDEKSPCIDCNFIERNERIVKVYSFLFLGCLFAVSFWHTLLPAGEYDFLFSRQIETIENIRSDIPDAQTGNAFKSNANSFFEITINNFRVMFVAFIFSFVFGSGALFIIFWNASVIGVFVSQMAVEIGHIGIPGMAHMLVLTSIFLHGMPEAIAYFIAGIAGGILSIGIIRGKHDKIIMKDAFVLFCTSLLLIVFAGFVEVWISPFL